MLSDSEVTEEGFDFVAFHVLCIPFNALLKLLVGLVGVLVDSLLVSLCGIVVESDDLGNVLFEDDFSACKFRWGIFLLEVVNVLFKGVTFKLVPFGGAESETQ